MSRLVFSPPPRPVLGNGDIRDWEPIRETVPGEYIEKDFLTIQVPVNGKDWNFKSYAAECRPARTASDCTNWQIIRVSSECPDRMYGPRDFHIPFTLIPRMPTRLSYTKQKKFQKRSGEEWFVGSLRLVKGCSYRLRILAATWEGQIFYGEWSDVYIAGCHE